MGMAEHDRKATAGDVGPGDRLDPGERDQLAYALETRFAVHREAAAQAVREAERELADVRDRLARALEEEEGRRYRSEPLVFMRESVKEEVEALSRKTTPKKVRTSYRWLLDRAVELAAGEVQGYHDDQAAAQRHREHGVEACRAAEQRAVDALEAARVMQDRVRLAEEAAREGLAVMVDKLAGTP
jgi:hypothetical protein